MGSKLSRFQTLVIVPKKLLQNWVRYATFWRRYTEKWKSVLGFAGISDQLACDNCFEFKQAYKQARELRLNIVQQNQLLRIQADLQTNQRLGPTEQSLNSSKPHKQTGEL